MKKSLKKKLVKPVAKSIKSIVKEKQKQIKHSTTNVNPRRRESKMTLDLLSPKNGLKVK